MSPRYPDCPPSLSSWAHEAFRLVGGYELMPSETNVQAELDTEDTEADGGGGRGLLMRALTKTLKKRRM